jgi:hypothetical protein
MRPLWDSGKFTAAELAKQFGISVPSFPQNAPKESEEGGPLICSQSR